MNNNLYHWHDNWMAELEMRQVREEMEHVRMLKEAGITGNGWLDRAWKALSSLVSAVRSRLKDRRPTELRSYPVDCDHIPC